MSKISRSRYALSPAATHSNRILPVIGKSRLKHFSEPMAVPEKNDSAIGGDHGTTTLLNYIQLYSQSGNPLPKIILSHKQNQFDYLTYSPVHINTFEK